MCVWYNGFVKSQICDRDRKGLMSMNELKLKAKCVEKGLRIADLANYLNIDQSTMYRKIDNKTLTIKEVNALVVFLELTENDILSIFFEKKVA